MEESVIIKVTIPPGRRSLLWGNHEKPSAFKIQTHTKENNMSSTSSADESVSKSVVLTCYQCLFLMNEICDNFRSSVSFKFCNNRMHLYRKCAKHSFRFFLSNFVVKFAEQR